MAGNQGKKIIKKHRKGGKEEKEKKNLGHKVSYFIRPLLRLTEM